MLPKSAMQGSHCGEAAPVLAVPVDGGLPNPKGLGVFPSGASGVETTGV
ncbi:hypothetical protein [Nostoc sp.]